MYGGKLSRESVEEVRRDVLKSMAAEVREVNTANGWFDDQRSFGEGIALMHSEVSEALEAFRSWGLADATKLEPWEEDGRHPKPEGVGSEFADVLIRLLDECDRAGIDLAFEFERKLAHNRTRGYKHGGRSL